MEFEWNVWWIGDMLCRSVVSSLLLIVAHGFIQAQCILKQLLVFSFVTFLLVEPFLLVILQTL
jgi:hypothetical protein